MASTVNRQQPRSIHLCRNVWRPFPENPACDIILPYESINKVMAPLFKKVTQLDPGNVNQAVKVRLIRCYALHGENVNNVYSLECVFHDAEGSRIHASIKKDFIPRFQNMLKEEHLYAIKNFLLQKNNLTLKTSTYDFKMVFIPKSHLAEVFDEAFPRHVFDFKLYDDLTKWENLEEDVLIDVIGRLASRGTIQSRGVRGKQTNLLDITLKNLQGNEIGCTIWGEYGEQLLSHVDTNQGPVVVIMQMCRVRKFLGEMRVSNTFKVSRIIFASNVQEIGEFQTGLVDGGFGEIVITNVVRPPIMTIREELQMSREKIISVSSLIRVHQIDHYWVLAQVVGIEPMMGWNYVACKKCFKSTPQAGAYFYCVKCDVGDPIGELRYKVLLRIADNWGVACFILWDKECIELIGKTALELQSSSTGQGLPKAITGLVGVKALFKVDVKSCPYDVNLGPFPIMKMTTDVAVISEFCNMASLSAVDAQPEENPEQLLAPARPCIVRSVPNVVRVGVKRNLMGEFSGNEDEQQSKAAKTDDV